MRRAHLALVTFNATRWSARLRTNGALWKTHPRGSSQDCRLRTLGQHSCNEHLSLRFTRLMAHGKCKTHPRAQAWSPALGPDWQDECIGHENKMAEVFDARLPQHRQRLSGRMACLPHWHAPPVGQRLQTVASSALGAHRAWAAHATGRQVEVVAFAGLTKPHIHGRLRSGRAKPHGDVA